MKRLISAEHYSLYFNLTIILMACTVLLITFFLQIVTFDLPCPFCLMQRWALLAVCVGPILNITSKAQLKHYVMSLFACFLGATMSGRQVLMHVVPESGTFGLPLFGWHLYTWAFVVFVGIGLFTVCGLWFDKLALSDRRLPLHKWQSLIVWLPCLLAFANVVSTFFLCGFASCASNPTHYWLF